MPGPRNLKGGSSATQRSVASGQRVSGSPAASARGGATGALDCLQPVALLLEARIRRPRA